jgi:hypothetical protein
MDYDRWKTCNLMEYYASEETEEDDDDSWNHGEYLAECEMDEEPEMHVCEW